MKLKISSNGKTLWFYFENNSRLELNETEQKFVKHHL